MYMASYLTFLLCSAGLKPSAAQFSCSPYPGWQHFKPLAALCSMAEGPLLQEPQSTRHRCLYCNSIRALGAWQVCGPAVLHPLGQYWVDLYIYPTSFTAMSTFQNEPAETMANKVGHLSIGGCVYADVVSPPESDQVDFLPGSVQLSSDGRLLAVAAIPKASSTPAALQTQGVTAGYIYRIVAQPHSNSAFRYQLAGKLTLPVDNHPNSSDSTSSSNTAGQVTTALDMSADGQTVLACWARKANKESAGSAVSSAAGGLSGGAAVFAWKGFGQVLHAVHLPVPPGMKKCECQLQQSLTWCALQCVYGPYCGLARAVPSSEPASSCTL